MVRRLRRDRSGVASAVAAMLALLVMVIFLGVALVDVVPKQQYDAEFVTTESALSTFSTVHGLVQGPLTTPGPGQRGSPVTIGIPLGTEGVSPFQGPTVGILTFDPSAGSSQVVLQFVPHFNQGRVTRIDQDVVLAIDSSGSMVWNDPGRLRISGAKEYIGRLACPDHVAIVDFDSVAHLTRENVGGAPHHLVSPSHNCYPDFSEAKTDLDTIDSRGSTNFGAALQVAVNELAGYGDPRHARIIILLTDGQNTFPSKAVADAQARQAARQARDRGVIVFTIGLSSDADAALLTEIADTTGGTFYFASDPTAIRWIYFEISRRFQGAFACGDLSTSEGGGGRLTLDLRNRQYPPQVLTYEAGGIVRRQSDGARVTDGPSLEWQGSRGRNGPGQLRLDLVTLMGPAFSVEGSGVELLTIRAEGVDRQVVRVTQENLTSVRASLLNESATLDAWTAQGASTPLGTARVQQPLGLAVGALRDAQRRQDAGNYTGAKFAVDSASAEISAAIAGAQQSAADGDMQRWLADSVTDDLLVEGCRLTQWANWYEGVTLEVTGSDPEAWEAWLTRTASDAGAPYAIARHGDTVALSVRAVDMLFLERRIVSVAHSGG